MSEPTLSDVLAAVERIEAKVDGIEAKLEAEVKRWDERFFKFAEDTANRANTLIASATIAVIAGTLLLILREGSLLSQKRHSGTLLTLPALKRGRFMSGPQTVLGQIVSIQKAGLRTVRFFGFHKLDPVLLPQPRAGSMSFTHKVCAANCSKMQQIAAVLVRFWLVLDRGWITRPIRFARFRRPICLPKKRVLEPWEKM